MKRFLSVVLALLMLLSTAAVGFADDNPDASCEPSRVRGGEKVLVYTSEFYTSDGAPLDCELEKEYHHLSVSWKKGGSYIDRAYFEEGDNFVTIVIKSGITTTSDQEIRGTLKIRDTGGDKTRTYTAQIRNEALVVETIDERSDMSWDGDKEFSLPYDYMEKKVRFVAGDEDDRQRYGTFTADFDNDRGDEVAQFVVKIVDQPALFLAFNETENAAVQKNFPNADLRFVTWSARPTFELTGRLSIYMEPDEYIYGIKDDNSIYRLDGKYDTDTYAYVLSTATLGSYVISDVQLLRNSASSTAPASSSAASSRPPASSSSTAPAPSSSSAPAPSSSSTPAPAPSSSSASSSSSSALSESSEAPSSSEPEPSSSSSAAESPASRPTDTDPDDDEKEKGGFPLVPVLIGVLAVVIVVCGIVVMGNKGSNRKGSRKKRFDDWDD